MKRQCSHILGFILYDCVLHFQTVISVFPNQHKLQPAGFRGRGTDSSSFVFSPCVQPPLEHIDCLVLIIIQTKEKKVHHQCGPECFVSKHHVTTDLQSISENTGFYICRKKKDLRFSVGIPKNIIYICKIQC